jgi:hypothetical protein
MLRRHFLSSVMSASAVALCSTLAGGTLAFADELNAPLDTVVGDRGVWRGVVKATGAYVRRAPSSSAELVAELAPGDPLDVDRWVAGSEVYPTLITWGHLADGRGYVYGSAIQPRPSSTPYVLPPESRDMSGRWIDVNLTQNVIAACEGQTIRGLFPTSPGRPGLETTRGMHSVRYQAAIQDMAGPGYYVHGVRWISYFLPDGEAIHARTWDTEAISFGVPSSHGCLGVPPDAAEFLFNFAAPGTPVYVHD